MRRHVLLLLLLSSLALTAGCGDDDGPTEQSADRPAQVDGAGMQHIHGLGVAGDTLYIATHDGLWTAAPGTTRAERFGESRQDIMGFSVVDDRRFIGSGHPAPQETSQPPNLGLIESSDAGRSWTNVSLLGEVDFHVLQSQGQSVYGIDSGTGSLLASTDAGRRWEERGPPAGVFSLVIDPRDAQRIIVSTEEGVFASPNGGAGWRPLNNRLAGLLAWPRPDALYLIDGEGAVHLSRDGGQRWDVVGDAGGQPAAFIADGQGLYVALTDNLVEHSADGGRTWRIRAAP